MLDIRLPDIDGFELCRRLREQRKTQDVPIIFLTEKRDRVDKLQGLELGVVDYITKPFDIQELRLRVRNAIHRASLPSTVNPVTNLPEGNLVMEKISELLISQHEQALLQLSIARLSEFRSRYGFVAADDVMRAMTLMIGNAVREFGTGSDFIGHLENGDFVIITSPDNVEDILDRVSRRIRQSREYFYPSSDKEIAQDEEDNYLAIKEAWITSKHGTYASLEDLKKALSDEMEADASTL